MAPIVLFVYNRLGHTQRVVESLLQCNEATGSALYVFSDGGKNEKDAESVSKVREYLRSIKGFASLRIVERDSNLGLARNVIEGVSQVLEEADRVIVLEDDLIVSKGFLKYMNDALDFYEQKKVLCVSGYTPRVSIPTRYKYSTYVAPRNCSWGWGTWRNRWNKVDWEVKNFGVFMQNRRLREAFNKGGNDLSMMLYKQQRGIIGSWSIRFCFAGFTMGMVSVYPTQSLVENGGADGTGTNVPESTRYKTQVVDGIASSSFMPNVEVDRRILRRFRRVYNCRPWRALYNRFALRRYKI